MCVSLDMLYCLLAYCMLKHCHASLVGGRIYRKITVSEAYHVQICC